MSSSRQQGSVRHWKRNQTSPPLTGGGFPLVSVFLVSALCPLTQYVVYSKHVKNINKVCHLVAAQTGKASTPPKGHKEINSYVRSGPVRSRSFAWLFPRSKRKHPSFFFHSIYFLNCTHGDQLKCSILCQKVGIPKWQSHLHIRSIHY